MYLSYLIGGYHGLIALHVILMVVLAALLVISCRRVAGPAVALVATCLALETLWSKATERPPADLVLHPRGRAAAAASLHRGAASPVVAHPGHLRLGKRPRHVADSTRSLRSPGSRLGAGDRPSVMAESCAVPSRRPRERLGSHRNTKWSGTAEHFSAGGPTSSASLVHRAFSGWPISAQRCWQNYVVSWAFAEKRAAAPEVVFVLSAILLGSMYNRSVPVAAIALAPLAARESLDRSDGRRLYGGGRRLATG